MNRPKAVAWFARDPDYNDRLIVVVDECDYDAMLEYATSLEALAAYGEVKLREVYKVEADVEKLLSQLLGAPSDHRSFDVFAAEKLAAYHKAPGKLG